MKSILPSIKENYSQWYIETLKKAQLYENTLTKGAIIIKPYAYEIWQNITNIIQEKLKTNSYQNYYFPTLIPKEVFSIEKEQVQGMAKELYSCENAILRPTSESIISYYMGKENYSYRDLPVKINQWCNVFRKELRPRAFLRGSEFLWHESHAIYQHEEEVKYEINKVQEEIYLSVIRDDLAIFTYSGEKTLIEKFNGAKNTYTQEAFSVENKAIQIATVHNLSKNFVNAFNISYKSDTGLYDQPYQMCFGASTRLLGALVAVHGDEYGLRLPPKIAPYQIVIIQLSSSEKNNRYITRLLILLKKMNIRFYLDKDFHYDVGKRIINWELKGVPLQIRVGEKESSSLDVLLYRRIPREKLRIKIEDLEKNLTSFLIQDQSYLYEESKKRLINSTVLLEKKTIDNNDKIFSKETNNIYKIPLSLYSNDLEKVIQEKGYTIRCREKDGYIIAKSY